MNRRTWTMRVFDALGESSLSRGARHLLMSMAYLASAKTGVGEASQAELARYMGISAREVRRLTVEATVPESPIRLERMRRHKHRGRGRLPDHYRLVVLQEALRSPRRPVDQADFQADQAAADQADDQAAARSGRSSGRKRPKSPKSQGGRRTNGRRTNGAGVSGRKSEVTAKSFGNSRNAGERTPSDQAAPSSAAGVSGRKSEVTAKSFGNSRNAGERTPRRNGASNVGRKSAELQAVMRFGDDQAEHTSGWSRDQAEHTSAKKSANDEDYVPFPFFWPECDQPDNASGRKSVTPSKSQRKGEAPSHTRTVSNDPRSLSSNLPAAAKDLVGSSEPTKRQQPEATSSRSEPTAERVPCPEDLRLTDGQLARLSRALNAKPDRLRQIEPLVAADYVNSYDAAPGEPVERRHIRAWRGGLAKMLGRVWRDEHERKQYLGEADPVVPAARRAERRQAVLEAYEADLRRASRQSAEVGAQGLPRWFNERWPNGPPSSGPMQRSDPPGLREHQRTREGPGLAALGALLATQKKGA